WGCFDSLRERTEGRVISAGTSSWNPDGASFHECWCVREDRAHPPTPRGSPPNCTWRQDGAFTGGIPAGANGLLASAGETLEMTVSRCALNVVRPSKPVSRNCVGCPVYPSETNPH